MGVSDLLAGAAARRVHVLLCEVPGSFLLRASAEQMVRARGWVLATSPADSDMLLVCGDPSVGLAEPIQAAYDQLPGPRARVDVSDAADLDRGLDRGRDILLDSAFQAADARDREPATSPGDHPERDHGDMDHGDMDHGDMEMAPAGVALAGGAEDRDGLEMDELHVRLGPVLPHWPPGLVLRCSLHGDVVTHVGVERVGGCVGLSVRETPRVAAARRLDAVTSVLQLAGWSAGAAAARRARDACLDPAGDVAGQVAGLSRRVARAWLLRWMLRGLGPIDPATAPEAPAAVWGGDVFDRLVILLGEAVASLDGRPTPRLLPETVLDMVPGLVTGLELASVRLVVASLALPARADAAQPAGV